MVPLPPGERSKPRVVDRHALTELASLALLRHMSEARWSHVALAFAVALFIGWRVGGDRARDDAWREAEQRAVMVWTDGACAGARALMRRAMEEGRFDAELEGEFNFVDGDLVLIDEYQRVLLETFREADVAPFTRDLPADCSRSGLLDPYRLRPDEPY
jgi:hypothetical protein